MTAPQTPKGSSPGCSAAQQLGQTGVVIEMPGDQGHVDVARLADRFAVVQGFQNGEQAGLFLHKAGEGIQDLGALVAGQPRPFRLGAAGGGDGGVQIGGGALGDLGQHLAGGGVAGFKGLAGRGESAVDPVAEAALVLGQPGQSLGAAFGGGAVGHAVKDVADGHGAVPERGAFAP